MKLIIIALLLFVTSCASEKLTPAQKRAKLLESRREARSRY